MKAWILHGVNDIRLETVDIPMPGYGEVLVKVKAAGICGSDIQRVYGTGAHVYPLIIGHEFSGDVVEVGKDVENTWIGNRVGIYPLVPCGSCIPCQRKEYELCRNYSYLGSRRNGGFAEYAVVPAENIMELPSQMTYEEAAMLEPMAVAVHAMRRIAVSKSETIVVCGLGTIGMLLLMFFLEAGESGEKVFRQCSYESLFGEFCGKILVIGNKESQKRRAVKMGLHEDHYCDSRTQPVEKWLLEHTDEKGADVFFECVGKNETFVQAVNHTAPGGKVVLIGNPYSDMKLDRDVYWKILRNQLTVTGTWNSSFTHNRWDDWHYATDRMIQKRVNPAELISHRFSLEDLMQGMEIMRDKTEEYVKILFASFD